MGMPLRSEEGRIEVGAEEGGRDQFFWIAWIRVVAFMLQVARMGSRGSWCFAALERWSGSMLSV